MAIFKKKFTSIYVSSFNTRGRTRFLIAAADGFLNTLIESEAIIFKFDAIHHVVPSQNTRRCELGNYEVKQHKSFFRETISYN